MENILNKVIKCSLYLLVFLLPLFFLPWTVFPVIQNKQMLLGVFVFLLLILWLGKIMISGKLSLAWGKLSGSILLLLIILGISTAFSGTRAQSFWGMSFESDTFFSFILYGLTFFLFANLLQKKEEISKVIYIFLASSGVLALFFLIQSLVKPILPWAFTQTPLFNPIGSVQALAIFLGGAFLILLSFISINQPKSVLIGGKAISKKLVLGLTTILGILLFACIFIINYWLVWFLIALGLVIIMAEMAKSIGISKQESLRRFTLPLLVLILALLFIFIKIPFQNIVNIPPEVSLTYKATSDISVKTLQESSKNLILGSGPATFGYQYDLHRGVGPNLTDFWQIRFSQGAAALPTFLATSGILGILAILFMLIVFFWQGFKRLLISGNRLSSIAISSFAGGFYFLVLWFFYPINLSLIFVFFLMLGLWAAITGKQKEFLFTQSPQKAFLIMLLGVIFIVGSVVAIYNLSQKYLGALNYSQGLSLINAEEPKLDEGIIKINQAIILDGKDIYFRDLSQAFIFKINEVLNNQELSEEERQAELQRNVSNAEIAATAATQINSQNSQNWFQLGVIYENLFFLGVEGVDEAAILNYQKAAELNPQNPQIPLNMGRVYKTELERLKVQLAVLEASENVDQAEIEQSKEAYSQNFDLSMEYFNKSAELKPNFSATYYLIAQNYETNDEKEKALENYQLVLQLEPENEEIQQKVEELSK